MGWDQLIFEPAGQVGPVSILPAWFGLVIMGRQGAQGN